MTTIFSLFSFWFVFFLFFSFSELDIYGYSRSSFSLVFVTIFDKWDSFFSLYPITKMWRFNLNNLGSEIGSLLIILKLFINIFQLLEASNLTLSIIIVDWDYITWEYIQLFSFSIACTQIYKIDINFSTVVSILKNVLQFQRNCNIGNHS